MNKEKLAKDILDYSAKKIRLSPAEIDRAVENFLTNKASEDESIYLAKSGDGVIRLIKELNKDRPIKSPVKESRHALSSIREMRIEDKEYLAQKILDSAKVKTKKSEDEINDIFDDYRDNIATDEERKVLNSGKSGYDVLLRVLSRNEDLPSKNVKESIMKNSRVRESVTEREVNFIMNFSNELKQAKEDIKYLNGVMKNLPEAFFAEWEEDPKDPLKKCDDDICNFIVSVSMLDKPLDTTKLIGAALDNYESTGTEPQFIFDHISAFKNYIKRYCDTHDLLSEIDNGPINESGPIHWSAPVVDDLVLNVIKIFMNGNPQLSDFDNIITKDLRKTRKYLKLSLSTKDESFVVNLDYVGPADSKYENSQDEDWNSFKQYLKKNNIRLEKVDDRDLYEGNFYGTKEALTKMIWDQFSDGSWDADDLIDEDIVEFKFYTDMIEPNE